MKYLAVAVDRPGARPAIQALPIRQVLVAGYTGRDRAKIMEHIEELKQMGIPSPDQIPTVFVVPPAIVTTESRVAVSSASTSGEAEFYLLNHQGRVYVGVCSDHTDRAHEAINMQESKEICPKVLSDTAWDLADVQDHWDALEVRCWVTDAHGRRIYQEGKVDSMLSVPDLLAALKGLGYSELEDRLILGGTLPTAEGFVFGSRFEIELKDPVLGRTLSHAYDVAVPD